MSKLIKVFGSLAFLVAVVPSMPTSSWAADMAVKAVPAATAWNPWMIRLRALGVITRDSGTVDQVPGSDLATSDALVPELDITYFFTPNIAAEIILGVTKHRVTGAGAAATNGLDVGEAWLLPPTVTLQYHFTQFGAFKPYIGAGVNYTFFFNESAANTPGGNPAVRISSFKVNNAWAPAVQAGFDYMLDKHWGINFDVKYLWLQPTFSASVNDGAITLTGKAKLDPWIYGGGITYKF
jgi:outer membrane protein